MTERPYPRKFLQPDRLYREAPTGRYFTTPDGTGCHWFDTRAEAMDQVGDFGRPVITIMSRLEE
jgi:hypothetical protein